MVVEAHGSPRHASHLARFCGRVRQKGSNAGARLAQAPANKQLSKLRKLVLSSRGRPSPACARGCGPGVGRPFQVGWRQPEKLTEQRVLPQADAKDRLTAALCRPCSRSISQVSNPPDRRSQEFASISRSWIRNRLVRRFVNGEAAGRPGWPSSPNTVRQPARGPALASPEWSAVAYAQRRK